ncbi:uncharacterized protein BKCO1_4800034 [Diplodia corticola]|uniref:RelA/SpoT domain-containing protein n=1 Tax=Diplodia corticola TaxID=236234 RepID=A0A1J9RFV0_9PEZI|nr:uncharacterized protein BKCO1_4800034 [Diplodia corticola]OJD31419.1 hypothetical protein BKCO1_4800034 [Diplodia corticola]
MATDGQSNDPIAQFLHNYGKDKAYYESLANYVKNLCEGFMRNQQIDGTVTARAKDKTSLDIKVNRRHRQKSYATVNQIKADIADLSGVRIALFYPYHRDLVGKFIHEDFDVVGRVVHPKNPSDETGQDRFDAEYENRFRGYNATHYRVRLGEKNAKRNFRPDLVEIQVMTVLQSAWSEVEHNILYKKLEGNPSYPERQLLDGLSGLVSVSELYLEQLNTMFNTRVELQKAQNEPFANKYELGSFLFSRMRETKQSDQFTLSSVELLRRFLGLSCFKLDTKEKLGQMLNEINIGTDLTSNFTYPYSEKPNVSLVIMERLYPRTKGTLKDSLSPREERDLCSVLISTIISLDELFPPTSFWEKELTDNERSSAGPSQQLDNLKWMMNAQAPRNVLLGHLNPLNKEERDTLVSLWKWFSNHKSKYVRFVFDISKLGHLREFPQDIAALERVYHMAKDLLGVV